MSFFNYNYLCDKYEKLTKTEEDYKNLCDGWIDKFKYPYELIENDDIELFDFDASTTADIREFNNLVKILKENVDYLSECELKIVKEGIIKRINHIKYFCYTGCRDFINDFNRRYELENIEKQILEHLFKRFIN